MNDSLTFSQRRIADFSACRRRFQLRYLERLSWPVPPLDDRAEVTRELGQRFHQILHRHFIGLPVEEDLAGDPQLEHWWQVYHSKGPELPKGRLFPEFVLTVPIGGHLFTGRFDLLVLGEGRLQIFDWKTDFRPSSKADLQGTWQTRLYLALAAEAGPALKQTIEADQISLTYWYANDPEATVAFEYSQEQHDENWSNLREVVNKLDALLALTGDWPLTDDLGQCDRCAFQVYCGRIGESLDLEDWDPESEQTNLEPARP